MFIVRNADELDVSDNDDDDDYSLTENFIAFCNCGCVADSVAMTFSSSSI